MLHSPNLRTLAFALVFVLAIASGCGGGGGNDNGLPTGAPEPYVPPTTGTRACELSADCSPGTFCDLGECIQACNTIDACTGELSCTPRGRCQEQAHDLEPPPPVTPPPSVRALVDSIEIDEYASTASLDIMAADAAASIRYRVSTDVPWLQPTAPRGEFVSDTTLMFTVNRDLLAAADSEQGSITVTTAAGSIHLPVSIRTSLTGVYEGRIAYQTPTRLGSSSIRLELRVTGGTVEARVDPRQSPLFPIASSAEAVGAGVLVGNIATMLITQRFTPADLGPNSIIGADVGRSFNFEFEVEEDGSLSATFTDTWTGLLAEPFVLGGTIVVQRVPDQTVSPFVVGVPPPLPGNNNPAAPTIESACGAVTACTSASMTSELLACAATVLDAGYGLEDPARGLNIPASGSLGLNGYETMATTCQTEIVSTALPSLADATCVRPANLNCAKALFGRAAINGNDSGVGVGGLDDVVTARASTALLVLNEALVDAYALPYTNTNANTVSLETATLNVLNAGRQHARTQLALVLEPYFASRLRVPEPAGVSFTAVQAISELVARDMLALNEQLTMRARRAVASDNAATIDALREEASRETVRVLLAAGQIGLMADRQDLPVEDALATMEGVLTTLSDRVGELREGVDPLGFAANYVYFDDPRSAGASMDWNYLNILQNQGTVISAAVAAEEDAEAATREYDDRTDQVMSQLLALRVEIDAEVAAVCGLSGGLSELEDDFSNCGGSASDLGVAFAELDEAAQSVEAADERVRNSFRRFEIEMQRWNDTSAALVGQLEFVDEQNQRINLAEKKARRARGIARWVGAITNSVQQVLKAAMGNPAALLNVASTLTDAAAGEVQEQQQALIADIGRMKEMNTLQVGLTLGQAEHAARVKELFIQSNEMALEALGAVARAETAERRIGSMMNRLNASIRRYEQLERGTLGSLSNDPRFRIVRDSKVTRAMELRELAIRSAYLAATAFQFETNVPWRSIVTQLIPARRAQTVASFVTCFTTAQTGFNMAFGTTTERTTDISVREELLGIVGNIEDEVTGESLTPFDQFQRELMKSANITERGNVGVRFATSIIEGNPVFSSGLCNDLITDIQIWLVGDGLGDNQAEVVLYHGGDNSLRSCRSTSATGDIVANYSLESRRAQLQAGINGAPMSAPDSQFFGRSVAASDWRLEINPGDSQNQDVDVTRIEDIVIRIRHHAHTSGATPNAATYAHPICVGL